jgi:hypothetical protein
MAVLRSPVVRRLVPGRRAVDEGWAVTDKRGVVRRIDVDASSRAEKNPARTPSSHAILPGVVSSA